MSDIADRVKKIVVEHLSVDEDKVTENASFIDDLGADSLDTVELVMAFEEEFGIEIPDDAAETIQSFGDAAKEITGASAGAKPANQPMFCSLAGFHCPVPVLPATSILSLPAACPVPRPALTTSVMPFRTMLR